MCLYVGGVLVGVYLLYVLSISAEIALDNFAETTQVMHIVFCFF